MTDRCDECGEDRETSMSVIDGEPRDLCPDCYDYLRDLPERHHPCWEIAAKFCASRANGHHRCKQGTCYLAPTQGVLL